MHIDPSWKSAQELGHLVRVDSLRKGQRFRCITGAIYTYIRPDGANRGGHHAKRASDELSDMFAGCAEVELVPDWGAASRECDDDTMF